MREVRLKSVWLLIIPFLWYARPTMQLLLIGAALSILGLFIRAMAAGFIHKEKQLTTTGPYAFTRNPLYFGSFFLGLGITIAGGQWIFPVLFLVFFAMVYGRTIRGEATLLTELFGDQYRAYAANVPLFLPRLTPWRPEGAPTPPKFDYARYKRNREYEALMGAVAGFAFLTARMFF